MTTDAQREKGFSFLNRGIVIALLLISLCLAVLALLSQSAEMDLASLVDGPYFFAAVLLQITALFLFVLAWFFLLALSRTSSGDSSAGSSPINLLEASAHIGVTLLGKYLPGKVWGLVGRVYFLKQRDYSNSDAIQLLLADQFLTFYTGLSISAVALLAVFLPDYVYLGLFTALLLSIAAIFCYPVLMQWLTAVAQKFVKNTATISEITGATPAVSKTGLAASMCIYTVHWLGISIVLALLYYPLLEEQLQISAVLLIAAIPLAMLTGFVALWAPAGIGVREGVIVGVLAISMPVELAASIAISYRLICIMNDLAMGTVALTHYGKSGLQALKAQNQ